MCPISASWLEFQQRDDLLSFPHQDGKSKYSTTINHRDSISSSMCANIINVEKMLDTHQGGQIKLGKLI